MFDVIGECSKCGGWMIRYHEDGRAICDTCYREEGTEGSDRNNHLKNKIKNKFDPIG